jgi:hypothetical protein
MLTSPTSIYRRILRILSALPALLLAFLVAFVIYIYIMKTVIPLLGTYSHITKNNQTGENEIHIVQASPFIRLVVTIDAIFVFIFSCFFYISFYFASLTDPGSVPLEYIQRHVGLSEIFKRIYNGRSVNKSSSLFRTSSLPPNVRGRIEGNNEITSSDLAKRSRRLSSRKKTRTIKESITSISTSTISSESSLSTTTTSTTIKNEKKNDESTSISITVNSLSTSTIPQMGIKQYNLITIRVSELDLNALDEPGPHDPRWCSKCSQIKPPRTHHCSMCMRCVTKMDHHCPWVGNCVGFQNYKAFVLLLIHGFSAAVFSLLIWAPLMSGIWMPFSVSGDGSIEAHPEALKEANTRFALGYTDVMDMFAFTLDASLCCSLMVLLGMHLYLISAGKTTLEATWRGAHPYDLGSFRANWESVMGTRPLFWFVPGISIEIINNTRSGTEWRAKQTDLFEYPLPRKGELEQIFGNTEEEEDDDETLFDINEDDNDDEANINEEHVGLISS